jgi:hypothetical protein
VRDEITKYLSTVMQSSADTLAKKLCLDRLSVARELHAMSTEGLLEREMKRGEYLYRMAKKDGKPAQDGVDMSPKTLPAGITAVPKAPPAEAAKPEVTKTTLAEVEPKLRRQIAALEDQASVLQLKLDNEVKHHQVTREEANAALRQLADLRGSLSDAINMAAEWKEKHDMLRQQLDQYDERKRFDAWFGNRPESKASIEGSALKEKMWESWLERSKLVEIAA